MKSKTARIKGVRHAHMNPAKKQIIIWCAIAVAYFVAIFVSTTIYFRTTGDAPLFLLALHHEFVAILLFTELVGKDYSTLSQTWQEIITFFSGMVYYAGTGALLCFLRRGFGTSRPFRGIFCAFLGSMLGYTIGAWIDGHPPILMFLNPPLFFVAGYIFGIMTFHSQRRRQSGR